MTRMVLILIMTGEIFAGMNSLPKPPLMGRELDYSNPLSHGLVGAWFFSTGQGDVVFDFSGNGNHANFQASASWSLADRGYCVDITGSNTHLGVPYSPEMSFGDATIDRPFSVAAWINMDDATKFRILSRSSSTQTQYLFSTSASDVLGLFVMDSTTSNQEWTDTDSALTSYQGRWVHVAGTYDGRGGEDAQNGIRVYLNGVPPAQTSGDAGNYTAMHDLGSSLSTSIGFWWDGNSYANGKISSVMLYERRLSDTEVLKLYEDQYQIFKQDMNLLEMYSPTPTGVPQVVQWFNWEYFVCDG